ncbi:MAG TPA: DUF805 domain-containing protein [Trebonia sp.]|jgi:uncharacterized membrane protein YhaH (DUF805 family)
MSTSGEQQNPYGSNPYADPVQEHVPGQRPTGPDSQQGWAGNNQQQGYGAYPQGNGYAQGNGYPPPGGGYAGVPTAYLEGAPAGFVDAARGAFGNIFTYRGRASRSAFWWFQLVAIIAYAVISVISNWSTVAGVILDIVVGIPMVLANISLAVRRLHDSNHTGWWWWIGFVPLVGWIISLVFYVLPSTPGPNRYNTIR